MNDLLDDLTLNQWKDLMNWLWLNSFKVTRSNVKFWRKRHNLSVSE